MTGTHQFPQVPKHASQPANERFGRWTEAIARGMGTPWFLLVLTLTCVAWITWNTLAPEGWRFDSAALGFTALTLLLSLQASYAAPMILLAQNRQDDRDRVQFEQDRQRAERNLADTEFLAREVVALRLAIRDLPDRDFIRSELRALLEELEQEREQEQAETPAPGNTPDNTGGNTGGSVSGQAQVLPTATRTAAEWPADPSSRGTASGLLEQNPGALNPGAPNRETSEH